MELEKLRIQIEADVGTAIRDFKHLEKVISAQAGAMSAAERAAKTYKNATDQQVAGLRSSAAQLRLHNTLMEQNTKATEDAGRSFSKWVKGTATEINSVMSILGRLGSVFNAVFDSVEEAARTNTAKMYFEDAGKSLERLRAASSGMVSDANLMKKANLADTMGLASSTFENLIRVAQAASAKTGQSFDHMFDSIVLGTARSSRLLLDNLGIIVNVKEANKEYAEEAIRNGTIHNMTVKEVVASMTDEAKKAAFLLKLEKASAKQLEQLKRLGTGGAATFDKWSASVDNLKLALSTSLLPVIEWILKKLTAVVDKVTKGVRDADLLTRYGNPQGNMIRPEYGAIPGLGPIRAGFDSPAETFAFNADKAFEALLTSIRDEIGPVNPEDLFAPGSKSELSFYAELLGKTNPRLQGMLDNLKLANTALERFAGTLFDKNGSPLSKEEIVGEGGGKKKREKTEAEKWLESVQKGWMESDKASEEKAKKEAALMKKLADQSAAYKIRMANEEREAEEKDLARKQKNWNRFLKEWDQSVKESLEKAAEVLKAKYEAIASGIQAAGSVLTGQSGLGTAFGGLAGGAIASAIGSPAAAPIGAAIGDIFGTMLDKLPGMEKISGALSSGFLNMFKIGFGPLFKVLGKFEQPVYTLMSAFGVLIQSGIDPFLVLLRTQMPYLTMFLNFISGLIVAGAPIIGIIAGLEVSLGGLAFAIAAIVGLSALDSKDSFINGMELLAAGSKNLLKAFVGFHNAIVRLIRKVPGMDEFGKILKVKDLMPKPAETKDDGKDANTEAVRDNTAALRDLSREFHNLPSGYKGNGAVFDASDPESGTGWTNSWEHPGRLHGTGAMMPRGRAPRRFNPHR